jgi:hypothetical protein
MKILIKKRAAFLYGYGAVDGYKIICCLIKYSDTYDQPWEKKSLDKTDVKIIFGGKYKIILMF